MTIDNLNNARLTAGISTWLKPSQLKMLIGIPKITCTSPLPVDGNHPSITAKSSIIIIPTQNVGRLKPKMDPVIILFEAQESGFNPAQTPNGIPKIMAIIRETTASSIVAGILSNIKSKAGSLNTNDSPRFPLRAFETKIPY